MIVNASSLPSERKTANYLLVMSDDIVAGAAKKNRNTIFRLNIKIAVPRIAEKLSIEGCSPLSLNRRHIHAN